jgi:hypothetical protein
LFVLCLLKTLFRTVDEHITRYLHPFSTLQNKKPVGLKHLLRKHKQHCTQNHENYKFHVDSTNLLKMKFASCKSNSPSVGSFFAGRATTVTQNSCGVARFRRALVGGTGVVVIGYLVEESIVDVGVVVIGYFVEFSVVVPVLVAFVGTTVLLTIVKSPSIRALETHGILTEVLFAFLHSGAVLLTQVMVLLTQLTCRLSVHGTVDVALTTHIRAPLVVQSDVVLEGQTVVVSPTQPTIAFAWISWFCGTDSLLW